MPKLPRSERQRRAILKRFLLQRRAYRIHQFRSHEFDDFLDAMATEAHYLAIIDEAIAALDDPNTDPVVWLVKLLQ